MVPFDYLLDTIKASNPAVPGFVSDRKALRRTLMDMVDSNLLEIDAQDNIYPLWVFDFIQLLFHYLQIKE